MFCLFGLVFFLAPAWVFTEVFESVEYKLTFVITN